MFGKITEKHLITGVGLILLSQVILSIFIVRELNNIGDAVNRLYQSEAVTSPVNQTSKFDVSVDDDPWQGAADASVVLVEFGDFECPACRDAARLVDELLEEYEGELLFVYRDFPLEDLHHALTAAEAANCAGEQDRYWDMYVLLSESNVYKARAIVDVIWELRRVSIGLGLIMIACAVIPSIELASMNPLQNFMRTASGALDPLLMPVIVVILSYPIAHATHVADSLSKIWRLILS